MTRLEWRGKAVVMPVAGLIHWYFFEDGSEIAAYRVIYMIRRRMFTSVRLMGPRPHGLNYVGREATLEELLSLLPEEEKARALALSITL